MLLQWSKTLLGVDGVLGVVGSVGVLGVVGGVGVVGASGTKSGASARLRPCSKYTCMLHIQGMPHALLPRKYIAALSYEATIHWHSPPSAGIQHGRSLAGLKAKRQPTGALFAGG